jgi:hypothetical protein
MRQHILTTIGALIILGAIGGGGQAETIAMAEKSLGELLGGSYAASGTLMTTNMDAGDLHVRVASEAYSGGGLYAYLYQIVNIGESGDSPVEMFTVSRFAGSVGLGEIGYLKDDGNIPAEFADGGKLSEDNCSVRSLTAGLKLSFYYGEDIGYQIDPGQYSRVLFVLSDLAPGTIWGNVINGDVASGPVIGATPEPGALVLLAIGLLTALTATWARRRST